VGVNGRGLLYETAPETDARGRGAEREQKKALRKQAVQAKLPSMDGEGGWMEGWEVQAKTPTTASSSYLTSRCPTAA
jgi:hypothetical protein